MASSPSSSSKAFEEGTLLSLQFWRDEAAFTAWRNHLDDRRAQALGRGGLFADYRLRNAQVVRDYGPSDREQAPVDTIAAAVG